MNTADVPPNQTVYVRNLYEKVKKEDLKKSLYHVFSAHGNILEIHVSKRLATRGQAWIVFDSLAASTKAVRELNGFQFYGKPMVVDFAKIKSDVIAKLDGTFQPRPKRKLESTADGRGAGGDSGDEDSDMEDDEEAGGQDESGEKPAKRQRTADGVAQPQQPVAAAAPAPVPAQPEPEFPNRMLFVSNLPPECNELMLSVLFRSYEGFERVVQPKPGIAFVEYRDEYGSGLARDALNNFQITEGHKMRVQFAKQ